MILPQDPSPSSAAHFLKPGFYQFEKKKRSNWWRRRPAEEVEKPGGGPRQRSVLPEAEGPEKVSSVTCCRGSREMLISVALGQVLSLLICGISLTSKYLSEDFHANTPVFQSFLNYILLFLVYTTTLAVRQGEENLLAILRRRWWKYMILGLIDLEANYLVVKAYQYTTLTSIQLLDCFVIPVVILLSWFFLLIRYKAVHFIGIVVCILGMGCMAGADVLVGRHQGAGENKLVGDLLVLGGATLYGISNVWEEYIIRTLSRVEFLGMIGLFGAFFSGIQLAIMEHKELLKVPWDWQIDRDKREAVEIEAGSSSLAWCFLPGKPSTATHGPERQGDIKGSASSPSIPALRGKSPKSAQLITVSRWRAHSTLVRRPKSKTIFISHHLSMCFSPFPLSTSVIPIMQSLGSSYGCRFVQVKRFFFLRTK
ncbi:solute carrier family 35 member F1 isoform X1 [Vicugna pacos]|uniref:Solute carrier family 35 member F1 isoform X1 n=1 Tax=Vicugna pacos TaxID=30538 RepID=A0ABM5DLV7_VICPA